MKVIIINEIRTKRGSVGKNRYEIGGSLNVLSSTE